MNAQQKVEPSIVSALAKALPELESAKKNKANPAFKSKYADLAAVIEALEPIRAHGLWYRQHCHDCENGAMVETFYIHESGQELSAGTTFMPASKKDAHGFGSALSYARRYGLQTAFGLATEDDDGNAAVKSSKQEEAPTVIDNAQWSEIMSLMQATNADAGAFCTAYKIANIRELPAAAFDRAKKQLNSKLAKMAEAEKQGEPA